MHSRMHHSAACRPPHSRDHLVGRSGPRTPDPKRGALAFQMLRGWGVGAAARGSAGGEPAEGGWCLVTGEGGPDSLDSLCPRRLESGAPAICARGHSAQGRQATQPPVRSRAWDPARWPPFPWTPEGRPGGGAGQSRSCGELESKGLRCLGSCEAPPRREPRGKLDLEGGARFPGRRREEG